MGYRFQKRVKLFGGFGLNLSKSGISLSMRGSGGSVGTKGYSIRTGIKGLTYRSGLKKTKNYGKTKNGSSLILVFLIALLGVVCYLLSTWIFYIYIGIISSAILVYLLKNGKKNEQETTDIIVIKEDNSQSKSFVVNSNKYDQSEDIIDNNFKRVNIDHALLLCLQNLCDEIFDIITDAGKQPDTLSHTNYNFENLRDSVIFDFCRIFYYLNISIYDNRIERDILLVASGYFFEPQITVDLLNDDLDSYEKFIEVINNHIYSPHPLGLDISVTPFVLPELLKKYDFLFNNYINKLREFTALITTIDLKLTKEESKILELIRKL